MGPVPHGRLVEEGGQDRRLRVECEPGWVVWGVSTLQCRSGVWSPPSPPSCRQLSCGPPPPRPHARHTPLSGSSLMGDTAHYYCLPGWLLITNNSSSEPVARERVVTTCGPGGEWSGPQFTCVNATQLEGSWTVNSAFISINIIYILLALLVLLTAPLLALHCCGPRLCRTNKVGQGSLSVVPESLLSPQPSPATSGGVYSVTAGKILQPATVSPSTLRSLSPAAANSFKPGLPGPASLPAAAPGRHQSRNTRTSLPFHFDSPLVPSPASPAPLVDESGYASLVRRQEPLYEPIRESTVTPDPLHTYDSVPRGGDSGGEAVQHEYANMPCGQDSEQGSTASFPDLLEMVTRSKTPSPRCHTKADVTDNTDVGKLYAKVDLSRKRSRPNSEESTETVVATGKENLDSYTKTLINRFNSFLEQEGHVNCRK